MAAVVLTLSIPYLLLEGSFADFKKKILAVFAGEIEAEIKIRAPVDKGYLREHWTIDWPIKRNRISLGTNAFYAAWLSRGTGLYGPHKTRICARGARPGNTDPAAPKALVFTYKGQLMIRRCVKGIKPNPYVENGIEAGVDSAMAALADMAERGTL